MKVFRGFAILFISIRHKGWCLGIMGTTVHLRNAI